MQGKIQGKRRPGVMQGLTLRCCTLAWSQGTYLKTGVSFRLFLCTHLANILVVKSLLPDASMLKLKLID